LSGPAMCLRSRKGLGRACKKRGEGRQIGWAIVPLPFFTERQHGPGCVPEPPVRNDRDRPFIALDLCRTTRRASQAGVLALLLPFLAPDCPRRRRCGRPRTPSNCLGTPSVNGDRSARVVDARAVCRLPRGCSASFSHCCENHIQVSLSPTDFSAIRAQYSECWW